MAFPQVVFVLSDQVGMIGGASKATLLLCEALRAAGAEVTVFARLPIDTETRGRLSGKGVRMHTAVLLRGARFGLPEWSIALRLWISSAIHRPGLVHAVGMTSDVKFFLSLPMIPPTVVWETTEAHPLNKFVATGVASKLRSCTALLVPSRTIEKNARSSYAFDGPVRILPFWAEDRSHPATAGPGDEERTLLFIGRLDPDKGFQYLMPAFQKARRKFPGMKLVICGGGDRDDVPELKDPPEGVDVRGRVTSQELDELFACCTAVVLPSLQEGYPISLLEACVFGKPIIATTVGSIPEVFSDRKCAILVPPADVDSLEAAILTLFSESPEIHACRSADARSLYEEISSPAVIRDALARAYEHPGQR